MTAVAARRLDSVAAFVVVSAWLSTMAQASPFAPHPLPPAGSPTPFFEGWYTRVVDPTSDLSFAVIVGGYRPPAGTAFTQVWCCLLMDDGGEITTIQRFADPQTLSITVDGRPVTEKPKFGTPARFKWHTEEALNSTLVVDDGTSWLDFEFKKASGAVIRVEASLEGRVPWDKAAPDTAGPEGWLSAAEGILPTHYYVQTLASAATYTLTTTNAEGVAAGDPVTGRGWAHQEANWGGTFPTAWAWAEGITTDGTRQIVLTSGAFVIAGVTTKQSIIAVRTPSTTLTFRNIDLDVIETDMLPCAATPTFSLTATLLNATRRVVIELSAARETFSVPLEAPTRGGFAGANGSVESFSAGARVSVLGRRSVIEPWDPIESFGIAQAALEFGGLDIKGCINGSHPQTSLIL